MCLLSIAVTPGEWFCSSCQGWSGLCSPLDGQSPEVIPLFSCPNPSPNEEANTWSTQRAGAAFPLLAALCSSLLPWGRAALSVCRIQVYINDTTPKYGLLENSGAGTQHHCSHTNSRHFTYVKKKNLKNLKNNNKRLNHAKSCKCLPQVLFSWCDREPVLSLGGTATILFTSSFTASLANSPLQLFGYFLIQGLH